MSAVELIFVVSDRHCGSLAGLCYPSFPTEQGSSYTANMIQCWLYDKWVDSTERWIPSIAKGDPWVLVDNGDAIEGRHHDTHELIHHDVRIHTDLATRLLLPLSKQAAKTFIVRGTQCHARTSEDDIGKMVSAERDSSTGGFCWEQLQLKVNGTLCHFKHHIGTTMKRWTASSALASTLAQEQLEAALLGHEIPQVVVRSHRHEFDCYSNDSGLIVTTPPWQMLTRFGRRVTQGSFAVPGMIALDFRGLPPGSLPQVHKTLYKPDADPVMEL